MADPQLWRKVKRSQENNVGRVQMRAQHAAKRPHVPLYRTHLSVSVEPLWLGLLRVDPGPEEGGLPRVHVVLRLARQVQGLRHNTQDIILWWGSGTILVPGTGTGSKIPVCCLSPSFLFFCIIFTYKEGCRTYVLIVQVANIWPDTKYTGMLYGIHYTVHYV